MKMTNQRNDSFGFEWGKHPRTQYDSYSGTTISRDRFFNETKWPHDMTGQRILEVGSGSGRFTEIVASTGAEIVSIDMGDAVEVNRAANGSKPNVTILRSDLHNLPYPDKTFDKIFCFGVLQHTPDPYKAFSSIVRHLKPGGEIVIDVYRKYTGIAGLAQTRYFIRPFLKGLSNERLYEQCKRYIETMWGVSKLVHRIPMVGPSLNWVLLIPDYRDVLPLSEEQLKEWAILDSFDVLSPEYDNPQTLSDVSGWFEKENFKEFSVNYGYNGIVGRGTR